MDGWTIDLLLALQEDPPAALFTNRSPAVYSRGKAFAPLAEQKWVANALTYLKADATSKASTKADPEAAAESKKAPKRKAQPKWKQKAGGEDEDA